MTVTRGALRVSAGFGAGFAVSWAVTLGLTTVAQEAVRALNVCVGADRVLRMSEVDKPCRPGEERFVLASPSVETELAKLGEKAGITPSGIRSNLKVQAPFEVVDGAGKTILRVEEQALDGRGLAVFNATGRPVASVLAEGDGSGLVTTRSSAGETKLFSRSAEVGVAVHEVGKKRLELTKSPAGSFAVRAFNAGGLRVATFGATGEGLGVSSVGAGADWPLAAMTATDGRGAVQVLGPNGEPVVTLVDEAEGGKVQISSRAAVMLVEAGTESGRGFVRTGPGAYPSIFPFPISQIVGKK